MLKLGGSSTTLQTNGNWWVNLTFNGEGTKTFGQLSTKMYDKLLRRQHLAADLGT